MEDNNSADIALGRFGREPAARSGSNSADPDVLSAATAVQRWELDHSHSKREICDTSAEMAAKALGGLCLHRPVHPGTPWTEWDPTYLTHLFMLGTESLWL